VADVEASKGGMGEELFFYTFQRANEDQIKGKGQNDMEKGKKMKFRSREIIPTEIRN
jgi:hypothetical protein